MAATITMTSDEWRNPNPNNNNNLLKNKNFTQKRERQQGRMMENSKHKQQQILYAIANSFISRAVTAAVAPHSRLLPLHYLRIVHEFPSHR